MSIETITNSVSQQNIYANKAASLQKTADNKTESNTESATDLQMPRDEYIPSGDQPESSAGVYKLEKTEDGKQRIVFDGPNQAEKTETPEQAEATPTQPVNDSDKTFEPVKEDTPSEKADAPEEKDSKKEGSCTVNTDSVDREIKQLKDKRQQLEQQLNSAGDDEDKRKEIESQLSQLDSELTMKDNDAYRKQHSTYVME
jgi:hypothetical protein